MVSFDYLRNHSFDFLVLSKVCVLVICSMVLGSYAHFMWEAEDDDDDDDEDEELMAASPSIVSAV